MGILNYSCQKFYWVILSRSFLKMLRHVYSAIGAHFCNCWSLKMAPQLWFSLSSIKVMLVGQRMKFPLRQGWGGHTLWHTYIEWCHSFQSSKQKCTSSLNRKLNQKARLFLFLYESGIYRSSIAFACSLKGFIWAKFKKLSSFLNLTKSHFKESIPIAFKNILLTFLKFFLWIYGK